MSTAKTARILPAHFVMRRLHSLSGLFPIGVFLLEHVFTNAYSLAGKAAYEARIAALQGLPFVVLIEVAFIGLPLLFHAFYGLVIAAEGRSNVHHYRHAANWRYLMQRVTGLVALVFIGYHVWTTRLASYLSATPMTFDEMSRHLSDPWIVLLYLVGSVSVCFHFANGLWSAAIVWGITVTEAAQRLMLRFSAALFLVLSLVNVLIILNFAYPEGDGRPPVVAAVLGFVKSWFFGTLP